MGNDVGQNDIEEVVTFRPRNFRWRKEEASFLFDPAGFIITGFDTDGHPVKDSPGVPAGLIDPIAEYAHEFQGMDQGHAAIGGFVYRGSLIPGLRGRYVFVRSLLPGTLDIFMLGLGRDANEELYVLGNVIGIPSGNTGVVQRILPNK